MFKRATVDLLFILLTSVLALVVLSIMLVNKPTEETSGIENHNAVIITLKWVQNCDLDLWYRDPNGVKVYYGHRESPPAYLDIDVVSWRAFLKPDGEPYMIKDNQEIISIRELTEGEHIVNVHLFNARYEESVKFTIEVHEVRRNRVIYADARIVDRLDPEEFIVKFNVEKVRNRLRITSVNDDIPEYIVGQNAR